MNYISLFKASVKKFSDRIAVVDFDSKRETTYAELDRISSLVAGKLKALGANKGDFIIINMGRRMEYMAAYIGILKAGCGVVPTVPDYPEERINYIRENCGAKIIIGDNFFDDIEDYSPYENPADGDEPGLLVYTSGSTGNPKGILHSNGDLARSVMRHKELFSGVSNIVFGATALMSFMVHIFEYHSVWNLGGTVHIIPENTRKSARELAAYIRKHGVTIAWIPPQLLRIFKDLDLDGSDFQCALCAGERLSRASSDKFRIRNMYGMSELCGIVTLFDVKKEYDNTPIGKEYSDFVKVYVADENGNPVTCREGEIYVKGEFDLKYYKNEEQTRQFIFKQPDGKSIIHTGDIGITDEGGNITFVNRKDWMVKINGQRVETLEIELLMQNMPEIEEAAVKAFEDENSQTYLAAFYVTVSDIEDAEIKKRLKSKLPPYMIPRFFVRLSQMPKNVNGKLDRKALKEPDISLYKAEYIKPQNETEEKICLAFEDVLKCGKVGVQDDFFALGGDSVKVLLLIERAGVAALTPDKILSGKTPQKIAALCKENTENVIRHNETVPEICPLSEAQRGVYLECVENPSSVMYNIPMLCELPDCIDVNRFILAVKKVAGSHKALNITVGLPDGEPSMIYKEKEVEVTVKSVSSLKEECRLFVKPFDLENGPLYRFEVCECDGQSAFLFDIHHIIFDGTSAERFVSQIAAVYNGEEPSEEKITIFDVALYEKNLPQTDAYRKAREFFAEKLEGTDCDSRPVSDVLTNEELHGAGRISVNSDNKFSLTDVLDFTKAHRITENTLFLGAFAYALAKFNGSSEALICSVNNGRHNAGLSSSLGMFVKTLPLYFSFDENETVSEFLTRVQDDFFETMQYDCISFGELNSKYGVNTDVVFVYQSELFSGAETCDGKITSRLLETGDSQSDLDVMMLKNETGFELLLHYKKSLYSEEMMKSFSNFYFNVVFAMLSGEKLCDMKLTDEKDIQLTEYFNRTEKEYESDKTVVDIFKNNAAKTPDSLCLVFRDNRYTYRQVDEITDRLAKYLVKNGVGREKVVGILIERSEYMLLCALGVLKAGGAYLPLDPSYPPERLNFMMKDSGAMLLIEMQSLKGIIDEDFKGMRIFAEDILSLPDSAEIILEMPKCDDLFVIIYTSGSTGTPKGVMFEHSNALVSSEFFKSYFSEDETSRIASYASYGFDAHIVDLYSAVISGGTLYIIPEEMRLDLVAVRDYFNENGITHVVMTTQVGRQFALLGGFKTLKHLSVAGEKLTPLEIPEGFSFYNLYGPTEGSVITSAFRIDKYYKDVPIGKAVDNLKLYVVDKYSRLLPNGATGELWISGSHVTRGYLNRPEKTAEAYGENLFENTKGYERIYRTGDIVRLLSDGNIQFIGRRDGQVKIRGFRIELTEVEEIIRRFPDIKDATVAAFDENGGGKYICAYIVSDKEISKEELSDFIREEKPPYMVPAVIMQIDKIPLNQNHKVNKRALPVPQREASDITLPENDFQKRIFDVVSAVIGHGDFGINTDIYEAGLTSIGAVKLNVEIAKAFDVHVSISDIKANNTVKKLEKLLSASDKATEYAIADDYPITETQKGVFIECMSMPTTTVYNIPAVVRLGEKVDLSRLSDAIKEAFDAHYYLKTTLFTDSNGDIRAKRNDTAKVDISVAKCKELPKTESLIRPHKLLGDKLYRVEIYETDDGNYLLADFHHIICDGTSLAIFFDDISRAYAGEKLIKEDFSGFEAALEEENIKKSEGYSKAREYWKNLLSGCDNECLPKKEAENKNGGAGNVSIINGNVEKVRNFCAENSFTLNAFFNAVFSFTLSRFCGKEYPTYSTVYNGRNDSRLSRTASMLVRTIPVTHNEDGGIAVKASIRDMQSQLMNAMANDACSFAELSNDYGVNADVIFAYQGDEFAFDTLCGEKSQLLDITLSQAKAPISVNVYIKNGKFEIDGEYRPDMFSRALVELMLDAFSKAVVEFTEKEFLKDISMLTESGNALYAKMNDNDIEIDKACVHRIFERVAAENPDRTAIIAAGEALTYREFNEKANRLANSLIKLGVEKDTIIGFVLDRDAGVLITEMGIMKSGGAFLPMIPGYPDDRIEYCLTNAESPFVITTEAIKKQRAELFGDDKLYKTLTLEELLSGGDTKNPDIEILPVQLAYCIYTSGSTGTPKGVMIEHHSFTNFVQTNRILVDYYTDESAEGAALQVGSVSFDISLYEIYLAFCSAKTLCMATEDEIHNPLALKDLIVENNIQMILCTPSFMNNMVTYPEFVAVLKNAKSVMLGAEAFPAALYTKMREISPKLQILNGYGPTENTVCSSVKELHSAENITIGRPTGNVKYYVTDKFGNILPPYATGELIICGEDVSRGYVKLPEKNKASFFTLMGMPAYHSGDLVRLNADAEIDFSGRIDNQIKLRGFRVELDEIENTICGFEAVRQSKVLVKNNGSEDYLVGFFTADTETDIDRLTQYLKSKLTYYMVPAVLKQIDKMPLTPNGKIDKNGFPEVEKNVRKREGRRSPKKSLEQKLCEMFAQVLGIDEVFADDNFFELGGTSLTASKVTMLLMSDGVEAKYGDIFDNPTPEELSEFIESRDAESRRAAEKAFSDETARPALQYNMVKYAHEVERKPLGNILLTGAVGFLGIHILNELIMSQSGHIWCLVRRGSYESAEIRLKTMLVYYFSDGFENAFKDRISIIEADITDSSLYASLADIPFDTVINCAACVKHFSDSDILEKINVHGVENLIDICNKKNARLIQISTVSVPGIHTEETYEKQIRMHENELFVIDDMDNKYGISKYHAELKMLDAIENGLKGKIIRVGNLMGRHSDGEFQANMETNMFMSGIRGFSVMGMYPISHMTDPMRFSPVDCTARAVVLLAGTNDKFTAFNCDNRYGFDEMKIIDACNRNGIKIIPADDEYYYAEYQKKLGDERINSKLNGLAAYDIKGAHAVDTDNLFTTNILYRIGFSWPLVDDTYLDRAINSILTLDYFDVEESEES